MSHGYDANELKKVEKGIKKEVDDAVEAAKASPPPPDAWLWRNMYQEPRGCEMRAVSGDLVTPAYDPEYKLPA